MTLGQRLKQLRTEQKITQKNLGKVFGVAESTISMYESDSRMPDIDAIKSIAEYFNVSTDYLLGRSNVRRFGEVAAANSDVPYDELPPEALKQLEDYKKFLIDKYGRKKE